MKDRMVKQMSSATHAIWAGYTQPNGYNEYMRIAFWALYDNGDVSGFVAGTDGLADCEMDSNFAGYYDEEAKEEFWHRRQGSK